MTDANDQQIENAPDGPVEHGEVVADGPPQTGEATGAPPRVTR